MPSRSALRDLARATGILPRYTDQQGHTRYTTDVSREALLAAMGFDTTDTASLRRELHELEEERGSALLYPVVVCRRQSEQRDTLRVQGLPHGRAIPYHLVVRSEDGRTAEAQGTVRPRRSGQSTLRLPVRLPLGYHTIELSPAGSGDHRFAVQRRIVCPDSCYSVRKRLGRTRGFGVWANLYSVRSKANYGVGDLSDLSRLAAAARELGACFVAVNPLAALRNRGTDIGPYSPISRLYRNPIYLDVTAVPEFHRCAEARRLVASDAFAKQLDGLRRSSTVDYEGVATLKDSVLRLLFETFQRQGHQEESQRREALRAYVDREGDDLLGYATFRALDERYAFVPWTEWPATYRDPRSPAVRRFQEEQRSEIDYHRWLQFELDRQLHEVAATKDSQLSVGLLLDMPVGSSPNGSDTWHDQQLFVRGAHLGAPPDEFAPGGQDWGLCPLSPLQLQRQAYDSWIRLIRGNMRYAGALRIDHMMGLFRQYWIPADAPGVAGAYVAQRASDLLGIVALESHRNETVVIGEDLGTVPRGFQALLHRWGILSTRVLYFERNPRGTFRPASAYSNRAFVTAHTHDQAPLAGYWTARDLELRRQAGAYASDEAYGKALALRTRDRRALLRRLRLDGLVKSDTESIDTGDLRRAVHEFLSTTPAPLVGVSLDDLCGEADPVNLPGIPLERFPSWSRKMRCEIDGIARSDSVRTILGPLARARGSTETPRTRGRQTTSSS